MSFVLNIRTTRYRAYVVPADAREGDYRRETVCYLEALDDWEARRTPDELFGSRWPHSNEAGGLPGWFAKLELPKI